MNFQCLKVQFDQETFRTGGGVTGRVLVQVYKPKLLSSIGLSIEGYAKTQIEEGSGRDRKVYKSKEHHLKDYLTVSDKIQLAPDELYTFPFAFILPLGLPSTYYVGEHTGIKYYAVAKVHYPTFSGSSSCLLPRACNLSSTKSSDRENFTVVSPVHYSQLSNPRKIGYRCETFGKCALICCWCSSGHLRIEIKLPRSGFIVGEHIPVTLLVENHTRKRISKAIIRFSSPHFLLRRLVKKTQEGDMNSKSTCLQVDLDSLLP